ncbi:MAG TPA: hypothetical protein DCS93_20435 [Microscillaceae bacterium]|nr:hypothetical protein [Microscillaceae bacterium]
MKKILFLYSFIVCGCFFQVAQAQAQQSPNDFPRAFLSMQFTLGKHNVQFKSLGNSPGFSFGFKFNAGIYLVNDGNFAGGLQFTLLEGASNNKRRRQMSEDFDRPDKNFDKHIVYKFAMFRSSNVGWFSEIKAGEVTLFHQIGFGIFGLTENDPLYNLGMHNHVGIITQQPESPTRLHLGLLHDWTVGSGNPNYSISNVGMSVGGMRNF